MSLWLGSAIDAAPALPPAPLVVRWALTCEVDPDHIVSEKLVPALLLLPWSWTSRSILPNNWRGRTVLYVILLFEKKKVIMCVMEIWMLKY